LAAIAKERDEARAINVFGVRPGNTAGEHVPAWLRGDSTAAERTVGPARMIVESLTPKPGIREHYLPFVDIG
jgi:hypothetical protein